MATKKDLKADLAEQLGVPQRVVAAQIQAFARVVSAQLEAGKQVPFLGLGVLESRVRAARETVNPATKERMRIEERIIPALRVSANFKKNLNLPQHG